MRNLGYGNGWRTRPQGKAHSAEKRLSRGYHGTRDRRAGQVVRPAILGPIDPEIAAQLREMS